MEIIKFQGTDKRLYEMVAPLVMSPIVLRQNNNYPFKTDEKYIWYVAVNDDRVVGFMPVKKNETDNYVIDNYYIRGEDMDVLDSMLCRVIADREPWRELLATVHTRHVELFRRRKFRTHIEWQNYEKMKYCP